MWEKNQRTRTNRVEELPEWLVEWRERCRQFEREVNARLLECTEIKGSEDETSAVATPEHDAESAER